MVGELASGSTGRAVGFGDMSDKKWPDRVKLFASEDEEFEALDVLAKKHGMGEVPYTMTLKSARAWYNFHKPFNAPSHRWTELKEA